MNFDSPEKGEALVGAFEIMAERIAHVADAVNWINEVYPPEADQAATPNVVPAVNNVVELSGMIESQPTHDDYLSGLRNAA